MGSILHPARISKEQLLKDCVVQATRRGGPGGQHRNKVETAIVVTHKPTGITAQASERRSQNANREAAIERLRLNLAVDFRAPIETGLASNLWQSRARGRRLAVSPTHEDFPAILSEALDHIHDCDFDISKVSEKLEISSSQLVKLLKQHRPAFDLVNRHREIQGLGRLK